MAHHLVVATQRNLLIETYELIVSHPCPRGIEQVLGNTRRTDEALDVGRAADALRPLQQPLDKGHRQSVVH
ncbi:hypothetical protein D3C80_1522160 [compost metagenome]